MQETDQHSSTAVVMAAKVIKPLFCMRVLWVLLAEEVALEDILPMEDQVEVATHQHVRVLMVDQAVIVVTQGAEVAAVVPAVWAMDFKELDVDMVVAV